jgi:DNA-directed RNA polymerase subunit RPC12/RpoP
MAQALLAINEAERTGVELGYDGRTRLNSSRQKEMSGISPHKKSLVRLEAGTVLLIFVSCWLYLRYISDQIDAVLAVAGISAVSAWFIRCERCKSSIYYRAGGTRFPSYGVKFLITSRCPHCGLRRL